MQIKEKRNIPMRVLDRTWNHTMDIYFGKIVEIEDQPSYTFEGLEHHQMLHGRWYFVPECFDIIPVKYNRNGANE